MVLALCEAFASEGINVEFTLTDKFPNLRAFRDISSQYPLNLRYISGSVDATRVPPELVGVRTRFNAFHHFSPGTARKVLEDTVKSRATRLHFRIPGTQAAHGYFTSAYAPVCHPCNAVHTTFPMERLLWTYLIPFVPLICCWDGVVSQLRVYTIAELSGLTQGLEDYKWSAGSTSIPGQPGHLTYLLGASCSKSVSRIEVTERDRQ